MPQYHVYPNPYDQALPHTWSAAMPSRDDETPRRRRKDYDRDSTTSRDKQQQSQRSRKASSTSKLLTTPTKRRSNSKDKERDRERDSRRSTYEERTSPRKVSIVVPEMDRRPASGAETRPRPSYPTFSKAHSREAVGSRDDLGSTQDGSPGRDQREPDKRRNSTPATTKSGPTDRTPPSPPLTADEPDVRRSASGGSMRKSAEDIRLDERRRNADGTPRVVKVKASKSGTSLRRDAAHLSQSEVSSMPGAFPGEDEHSTPTSTYRRTVSTGSQPPSALSQTTTTDSDATSIAPDRKGTRQHNPYDHSPPSVTDSQPKTPTGEQPLPQPTKTPIIEVGGPSLDSPQSFGMTPIAHHPPAPPPPPPPPPPMGAFKEAPKVDYLLKNGGLPAMVPRRLIQASPHVQAYAMYQSPQLMNQPPLEEYAKVFSGVHKRLDDYISVLRHHGSLAVATGYKSVARRLLDKLSQVFARDISSQRCDCVICNSIPQPKMSDEEDTGVSWGEILEFTAGRQELPQWPPFSISPEDGGLGITGATQAPMQKLDIDVPEEYRDHYIRQNQKTKRAVQNWLLQQPDLPSSPPDEADEDTLMFAMMTKLDVQQRNLFIALMHGQSAVSELRAPTPAERPKTSSTALQRARKALQRLYRLERPPRDCECAMYLLNNPHLHGMLATLAEVNDQEWDILVSGRFDGFLWSGAEAPFPPSVSHFGSPAASRVPSRGANATPLSRNMTPFSGLSGMPPSRGPTPFSPLRNVTSHDDVGAPNHMFPSRGPTPSPGGISVAPPAPVQLDEDTEIAVLAEVERNLLYDMERFEDAFEVLHSRAELVRNMLRERVTGLTMQAQMRRGPTNEAFVRLDTPASGITDFEEEDDDGLGDLASLAPDDSASQISTNRRRRQRRERKTPAPVPEEDEGHEPERRHTGRRSKY